MPQTTTFSLLLALVHLCPLAAKPIDVFFGTGGRGAEGIYHATFNPDNGKFSSSKLAAPVGSPGFLTLHPNGKILYSVGRWDDGTGAVGYQISGGELKEFTRMACPDGGGCHIAVHPSGKFLLTAQYGGGSVALFPLDPTGKLGEPTVTEHEGGSKVVERRQESPHPHWTGFSPMANTARTRPRSRSNRDLQGRCLQTRHHSTWNRAVGAWRRTAPHAFLDRRKIHLSSQRAHLSVTTFAWDAKGTARLSPPNPPSANRTKRARPSIPRPKSSFTQTVSSSTHRTAVTTAFRSTGPTRRAESSRSSRSNPSRSFSEKHQLKPGCNLVACSGCGLQHSSRPPCRPQDRKTSLPAWLDHQRPFPHLHPLRQLASRKLRVLNPGQPPGHAGRPR